MKTNESISALLTIILGFFVILLISCQQEDYEPLSPNEDEVLAFSDTTISNKNARLIGCVQSVISIGIPVGRLKPHPFIPKKCVPRGLGDPPGYCLTSGNVYLTSCMDLDLLNNFCQKGCPGDLFKIPKWKIPDFRKILIANSFQGQNRDILMSEGFLGNSILQIKF